MSGSVITLVFKDCTLSAGQKKKIMENLEKVLRGEKVEAAQKNVRDSSCVNAEFVSHCHEW